MDSAKIMQIHHLCLLDLNLSLSSIQPNVCPDCLVHDVTYSLNLCASAEQPNLGALSQLCCDHWWPPAQIRRTVRCLFIVPSINCSKSSINVPLSSQGRVQGPIPLTGNVLVTKVLLEE